MSYKQQQLNVNNVTSHTHTIFDLIATEAGQQKIVDAINNINISAEIGEITVEASDTQTHTLLTTTNSSLNDINNNLSSIDGKFDGVLTTDASDNLLVYSSNIASTPLISGFATEETLQEIKVKTDDLTFSDDGTGVIELRVFDSQNNISLNTINDTITNKHLDSATDSVTVTGSISIDTTGLALESTLESIDGKINNDNVLTTAIQVAIKNASLDVNTGLDLSTLATETTLSSLNGKVNNDGTLTDAIQVAIKNASLDVNTGLDLSTLATEAKQDTQIEELVKVVNKKGDIEANIFYNQGAPVWADTVPIPGIYELDPNGWAYSNTNTGNAMNLFYFNGANEIKTLVQCVGQYAVVSNLGTKLNNSLIFAIYTKGSPFFTTRITHSPAGGVNLSAGGKFLIYWGAVPDDLYPNLPRLNFTDVTTTGPAIPTEEILSVSLNTDSGTPAEDILIFIESLGVVFNNGSVNQSRVLNLLSNRTPYILSSSTEEFTQSINTYLSQLNKTNDALDVYIKNDTAIAISGTVDIGNFPATQAVSGTVDIGNFPATQAVSGTVAISNTSIPVTGTFFQTTQPISGSVSVSNLPVTQPVSGSVSVSNFPATQPISGSISNLFTLDTTTQSSNTKLDTIHTDLDGLTFDGSSNLNVNINAGSLTVDSVKIKDSAGNNLNSTSNALNSYITNTSVDTHCYASSNGTNWHHLASDSNGQLNVHSKTQDGAGTDITSTTAGAVVGLDTASDLYAFDGTTRRRVLCDTSSRLFTISNIRDINNNGITSTDTTATQRSLDVASSLYTTDGSTRSALSSTGGSLNANITNNLTISNAFALDSTLVSTNGKIDTTNSTLTTTNTKLDTGNGYLNTINNATGDFTTTTAFGNYISNVSISGGSDSATISFTRGSLKRNVIAIYRDGSTSNTDSISFYTVSTSGSPTNLLLAQVYPITVGGFRQVTINLNLLPFNSLFIKNDSASTINNVYLTVLNG